MTVYVDELRQVISTQTSGCFGRRAPRSCHLMADTESELEAMAKGLELQKSWRHGDHYDLTANNRRLAIARGAVAVSARYLVRLRIRLERDPR